MKLVTAIIKPFKLKDVRVALMKNGVQFMTVGEAKGFGRQRGHTELYRGATYTLEMLPKVKVEVLIADEMASRVVEAIATAAHTSRIGDGKIFVTHLDRVIRIRTGETDTMAV